MLMLAILTRLLVFWMSGDEDADSVHGNVKHEVQLKPWLDPAALAGALQHWRSGEVFALENANFVWTTRLVCKFIRSFKSAETAWQFFCWVIYQPGFTHYTYNISRMITKLARHGCVLLVDQLLFNQRESHITKSMLLLYSSLLRALEKCKMNIEALDILDEMILLGISPDKQMFTG
ncbi:unnamed protein product [Fraxinus pennsylvanica]|uniref:Pentatricopeptide repeat-containing protein n=1 Tax=Fraxinus pennsylvanica TaxID=56036 RepID=A0AAD1Z5L6_9LAMI|nr:unnamed protein product [Fraxinus pennsylvanica]